jgi:hypothetical protein
VLDVVVDDDADAVRTARVVLGYARGTAVPGEAVDQTALRDALPSNEREAYDVRPLVETLADIDSVLWLREAWAPELVTALARIDGRPVGILANNSLANAGALTTDGSAKAADFLTLCESWRLPVVDRFGRVQLAHFEYNPLPGVGARLRDLATCLPVAGLLFGHLQASLPSVGSINFAWAHAVRTIPSLISIGTTSNDLEH